MKKICIMLLIFFTALPVNVLAQGFSTIRDDEIERYLKDVGRPVFEAANLEADNIKFFIVNDPELNAFVAGGQNMFIHTGLILEDDDPSMLIGVMAHETGHIAGGHLARKAQEMERAGKEAAVGYILGIAAAALGASPTASVALLGSGAHLAQRGLLKYSRAHEESADAAALKILKKIHISPAGLLRLLKKLGTEMSMKFGRDINPYLLTHPLSSERTGRISASLENDPSLDYPTPSGLKLRHKRIISKLEAFIKKPEEILADKKYSSDDVASRYARAIANYRALKLDKALELINGLITEFPDDPYFYELKGQMLFENGKVEDSIQPYGKAADLLPDSALIGTALAVSLLATDNEKIAIEYLEEAIRIEPKNPHIWHQLGVAYGRSGRLGDSYVALAEEASLFEKEDEAKQFIKRASEHIDINDGSPLAIRVKDLMNSLNLKN